MWGRICRIELDFQGFSDTRASTKEILTSAPVDTGWSETTQLWAQRSRSRNRNPWFLNPTQRRVIRAKQAKGTHIDCLISRANTTLRIKKIHINRLIAFLVTSAFSWEKRVRLLSTSPTSYAPRRAITFWQPNEFPPTEADGLTLRPKNAQTSGGNRNWFPRAQTGGAQISSA